MVSVSVKLKKPDAPTYVEYFGTLPTWEGLTSRIAERFNVPPQDIVVGYLDDAQDSVTLTNNHRSTTSPLIRLPKSSLWCWIDRLLIVSRFQLVHVCTFIAIRAARIPIFASWASGSDIYELSNSGKYI